MKLLLCRPSPRRNIIPVEEQNEKLPVDKLFLEYYPEKEAYKIMQKWFLEHTEYTHLVIAPDDLVVTPEHIAQLQKDLSRKDYPILSGMCNVFEKVEGWINISYKLEEKNGLFAEFNWMVYKDLPKRKIFQVEFSGFPLMAIRRDVLEIISFSDEAVFDGQRSENGGSMDLLFCWHCKTNNIPIYVDKRIDMRHLRASGAIKVGQRTPNVEFWKYGGTPVNLDL